MKPRKSTIVRLTQESLDERWIPISKAKSTGEMGDISVNNPCPFCEASTKFYGGGCFHNNCPATRLCNNDYAWWETNIADDDIELARGNALSIVRQLHEIIEEYSQ